MIIEYYLPVNFDEEMRVKAKDLIEKKCNGINCELCLNNIFSLATDIVTTVKFTQSKTHFDFCRYPMLQLICNNCGNTKFINAAAIGLIKPHASSGEHG